MHVALGENSENSLSSGGFQNDFSDIALHLSNSLFQNSPSVQRILQQCRGMDGSYNMCCVMKCLVKSPAIRDCLRKTNFQGTIYCFVDVSEVCHY